jgi:hypothetical protein
VKVNYVLSFFKDTALDYFEPYLVDDPADEPIWASDYLAFTEELYLYFGPYDQVADAELELKNMVMKDHHNATCFFVEFYRLASMLQYNDSALHRRAYLALPKRIKDEMVHFNKPQSLNDPETLSRKLTKGIGNDAVSSLASPIPLPRPRPSMTSRPTNTEVPRTTTDIKVKVPVIPTPMRIRAKARKSRKGIMRPMGIRNPSRTELVRMENSPPRNANGAWITQYARRVVTMHGNVPRPSRPGQPRLPTRRHPSLKPRPRPRVQKNSQRPSGLHAY